MIKIKFLNLQTQAEETENFADYAVYELFDEMSGGVAMLEWAVIEDGKRMGGGSGGNAEPALRAFLGLSDAEDYAHTMDVYTR